jgi:hypothetical protein
MHVIDVAYPPLTNKITCGSVLWCVCVCVCVVCVLWCVSLSVCCAGRATRTGLWHILIHAQARTCKQACARTHSALHARARTQALTRMHVCSLAGPHPRMHAYRHVLILHSLAPHHPAPLFLTHTHTHAQTHAPGHARARTHTSRCRRTARCRISGEGPAFEETLFLLAVSGSAHCSAFARRGGGPATDGQEYINFEHGHGV